MGAAAVVNVDESLYVTSIEHDDVAGSVTVPAFAQVIATGEVLVGNCIVDVGAVRS